MSCQRCNSNRLIRISIKHSDLFWAEMLGKEHDGYAPNIKGLCGGDYTDPTVCMECGQVQGEWPQPNPEFTKPECPQSPTDNHEWREEGDCKHCGMIQ